MNQIEHRFETSMTVFLIPLFFTVSFFLILCFSGRFSIAVVFFIIFGISVVNGYLIYKNQKFYITKNKIYLFRKTIFSEKEKIISWTFKDDFHSMAIKQNLWNKLIGNGEIRLMNNRGELFIIKGIINPEDCFDKISYPVLKWREINEKQTNF